ncbi:IS630 family transposase [Streptomyces sp. NPDC048362]|uniref:IS630 family transposase n=1 Tax=Streptomyces sp. NPDC048362 TaxID=3365539 RepID=UPI003718C377
MPSRPYVVCLGDAERAEPESLSRRATAAHRIVLRARIVLLAAAGAGNSEIAGRLGICEDTARKWRRRYGEKGLGGLCDAPRPGRPRVFPAAVAAQVKALACEMPAASRTPLARWTCPELARKAAADGIVPAPSPSTVRRWLAGDAIRPWQHRSWIFPRDPHYALKASRVLDLYQREWDGKPLGCEEYVISADEKPGVQARTRIHLPLPAGPRRAIRAESEYLRCGTLAYLAAYDVHHAKVMGRCEPSTGIKPFTALVDQVMTAEPYASAKTVFWVVDNGASHRNWAAAARLSDAYPNAQMVHLPVHASWLNQVEVYFSVIQRKLLTPDDFEDLDELAAQILAFEEHYNTVAGPFDWKFTRADLNQLLIRIKRHDRHAPQPTAA